MTREVSPDGHCRVTQRSCFSAASSLGPVGADQSTRSSLAGRWFCPRMLAPLPWSTCETVARDTPARLATSISRTGFLASVATTTSFTTTSPSCSPDACWPPSGHREGRQQSCGSHHDRRPSATTAGESRQVQRTHRASLYGEHAANAGIRLQTSTLGVHVQFAAGRDHWRRKRRPRKEVARTDHGRLIETCCAVRRA